MLRWLDAPRVSSVQLDQALALALHRGAESPAVLGSLRTASRLGGASAWLIVIVLLPWIGGPQGVTVAQQMLGAGTVNLLLYWALKRSTRRRRPFEQCPGIRACAHVPDHFSFPSGHTLHAVTFGLLLSAAYPVLVPFLWAFALLVGMSRVVLGMHYPSDVLAGGLIGAGTATLIGAVVTTTG